MKVKYNAPPRYSLQVKDQKVMGGEYIELTAEEYEVLRHHEPLVKTDTGSKRLKVEPVGETEEAKSKAKPSKAEDKKEGKS